MNTSSHCLSNDNLNRLRWLPLLTPALKEGTCDIDFSLQCDRVVTIALAALAIMAAAVMLSAVFPPAIIVVPLSICLFGIIPVDDWFTEKAANVKAVSEYLSKSYPSKSATYRIQNNYKAALLLTSKKGDLNKFNEEGDRLLDHRTDIAVFKLLIDNGAEIKSVNKYNVSYFQKIVEIENPAYLEYVLKNNKVKSSDFDIAAQMQFWKKLGSVKAGMLLKEHGFDVNIKDQAGYTPLLRLVKDLSKRSYSDGRLGIGAHVSALLSCGADRSITVVEKEVEKNALQMSSNPAISYILQQS